MATRLVQEGNVIKYQNSGSAISSGDVIVIGTRIAIALVDIAATTGTGAASLVGVWRFDKTITEGDLTQGTVMFWNAITAKVTTSRAGGVYVGELFTDVLTADTEADVRIGSAGEVPVGAETGFIEVPLGSITKDDGTALTKQATTVIGYAQLAGKETVILIPKDSGTDTLGFAVSYGEDLDDAQDVTLHVLAGKDLDLDVLTLDAEVYPVASGDVANADIQDTAALTIVEGVTELIFTCGSDGVLPGPGSMSVVLTQGGTNDGDAVHIHAVWFEYSKK